VEAIPIGRGTSEVIVTTLLTHLPRDAGADTMFRFGIPVTAFALVTVHRVRIVDRTDR